MTAATGIALFFGYVVLSCTGLYFLKVALIWSSSKFFVGAVLYVLGAGVWLIILRAYPLSIAFPVASGALMIGTTVIGYFILKEQVSWLHLFGIFAISTGVTILALEGK